MITNISTVTGKKSFPVISIALPIHPKFPQIKSDLQHIHAILKTVREKVRAEFGHVKAEQVNKQLNAAFDAIPRHHLAKSLLLYVTADSYKVISLPYVVQEKVIVDNTYEIRDLVYELSKLRAYMVVVLSKNTVKAYTNSRTDEVFHTGPGISESHKSTLTGSSHDVSRFLDGRSFDENNMHAYVHFIDELIAGTGYRKEMPLIIFGDTKLLGFFKKLTSHTGHVHYHEGNFEHVSVTDLQKKADEILRVLAFDEEQEKLRLLQEEVGKNNCETGIIQVWRAAAEGRGKILFVEKDYRQQARIGSDAYTISIDDSEINPLDISHDAVDDIMEMVLKNHGEIHVVEGSLPAEFQKIGLITRY